MRNRLYDKDRRVKVLLAGTPVSTSPLQSQYSKFLNFQSADFNIDINNPLYYNLVFKKAVDKVIVKKDGSNVGTGAVHYPNFINDFNVAETVATDTYDISLKTPNRVLVQQDGTAVNTTPRKLNFKSDVKAVENAGNDTVDISHNVSNNPRVNGKIWGIFSGASGSVNSSGGIQCGSNMMNNWLAYNKMTPKVDTVEGAYSAWVTGGTSTNFVAYYSDDVDATTFMRKFNPFFETKIRIPDISSNRMYIGFTDTLPLPNNQFNFLNSKYGFGVRFDTGQDSTWKVMYNDAQSTNPTPLDSGVTVTAGQIYTIQVYADDTNSQFVATIGLGSAIGTAITRSANIPLQTTPLGFGIIYTTQTGSSREMDFWYLYGESQK